ncbi:MAG TPA: hypothetical protein VFI25_18810 [Planctomycetota bacterium]|jgi:hypothetical protein|nr:hypothetical protein [Planctomycetota bacterium]
MDRRAVLKLAAAGATQVALGGPLLLQGRGVSPREVRGRARLSLLQVAGRRAREQRKPLLVLVVPRCPPSGLVERGRLLGGLLNHASDETFAALALCEVVCATVDATIVEFGAWEWMDDPLALLVERSSRGPWVIPIAMPRLSGAGPLEGQRIPVGDQDFADAAAFAEIFAAERLVRTAIVPDARTLSARAEEARIGLTPQELATLTAIADGKVPIQFPISDRGTAVLLELAEQRPARRPRVLEALRRAAYGRFLAVPPAGARWGRTSGCGFDLEEKDYPSNSVNCGMGNTPFASRRFLYLLTNP